jgi:hypothetical protein
MIIAVCLSGQVRTFAENLAGLHEMFVMAAGGEQHVHYFGALHFADRLWATKLPWQAVTVEQMVTPPRFHHPALQHPREKVNPERVLWEQYQGVASVGALVRAHEWLRGSRYQWIVRCRFDLSVRTPMEDLSTLAADAIYFPGCDNWYGHNDRFAFGPSVLMEHYFTFPRAIARYLIEPARDKVASEIFLGQHLAVEGVPCKTTRAVLVTNRGGGVFDQPVYHPLQGDTSP